MHACAAWLRWCCCGCCGACEKGAGGDVKGLLPIAVSHDDLPLKETTYYSYDVRRISSFGRGESKEKDAWSDGETVGYEPLDVTRRRSVTPAPSSAQVTPPVNCTVTSAKVLHNPLKGGTLPRDVSLSPASARRLDATSEGTLRLQPRGVRDTGHVSKGVDERHNIGGGRGRSGGSSGVSSGGSSCAAGGGDAGGDGSEDSRRLAPWHAALRRFKPSPARSRSKSPRPGSASSTSCSGGGGAGGGGGGGGGQWLHPLARLAPSLAISTPDLAQRSKLAVSGPRSVQTLGMPSRIRGASSSCLPRALTVEVERTNVDQQLRAVRSEASADHRHGRWSRRSKESVDYETEPSTPVADDVFQDGESVSLARSVGLDKNLYVTQSVGSFSSSKQPTSWPSSVCSTPSINIESFESGRTPIKVDDSNYFSSYGFLPNQESFVEQPCGTITFSASYYQKNKKLCIELDQLENLPPKGMNSVYDVIVRLSILPSDKQLKSTQILRGRSLSPLIKEDFNFSIKDPVGKIMRFTVFNSMFQGKHDAIGYACFNVEDVISGKPRKYSIMLTHRSQPGSSCGSLQVYLQLSQEQRLIVDVIQARNLCSSSPPKSSRSTDSFSTYIKIAFYSAGQKLKSKKSSLVTCDRNPQYEFSNDFKIVPEHFDSCYIAVSVVLKVSLRKDVTLGRYILGPNFFSGNQEITPWGRALLKREQVCHWFNLYL